MYLPAHILHLRIAIQFREEVLVSFFVIRHSIKRQNQSHHVELGNNWVGPCEQDHKHLLD